MFASSHLEGITAVIRVGLMKTERLEVYLDAIRRVARAIRGVG